VPPSELFFLLRRAGGVAGGGLVSDETPVILLAFANDADDYLKNIRRERQGVFAALRAANDRRAINVYKEEETSTEQLFGLFRDYADRVAIFHYGGHASGTGLRLEAASGAAEQANAAGLAQLLGMQKGLQLVFLNGCATLGQVETLLAAGVRAVIATSVPIDDAMATEFAEQFYGALGTGATIGRAFATARSFITTRYGADKAVGTFRGSLNIAKAAPVEAGLTWGMYLADGADAVLDWVLPVPQDRKLIVRGAIVAQGAGSTVNARLIAATLEALKPFSPEIQFYLSMKRPDPRVFPDLIMNAYPVAIGIQLQKLFSQPVSVDMARLRQFLITYEVIGKLFCYVMISQLWDWKIKKPDIVVSDEQWSVLNRFLALNAENQPFFDYFAMTTTIVGIFNANGIQPFVSEFSRLTEELTDVPTTAARAFMDDMRIEFREQRVPAEEIASFCEQCEGHLATLLADFAFVAKYPFSTIRRINLIKSRNREPTFIFEKARLDKPGSDFGVEEASFQTFAENQAVIVQTSEENALDYLNLTPFVVDESALTGAMSTRLFLYDYRDDAGDFHYVSVNDADVRLIIADSNFPAIKDQARDFFDTVYRS
jgi:hypothetical protein